MVLGSRPTARHVPDATAAEADLQADDYAAMMDPHARQG
jgi:hypothetical protein